MFVTTFIFFRNCSIHKKHEEACEDKISMVSLLFKAEKFKYMNLKFRVPKNHLPKSYRKEILYKKRLACFNFTICKISIEVEVNDNFGMKKFPDEYQMKLFLA